jgi:hypothetical protein
MENKRGRIRSVKHLQITLAIDGKERDSGTLSLQCRELAAQSSRQNAVVTATSGIEGLAPITVEIKE